MHRKPPVRRGFHNLVSPRSISNVPVSGGMWYESPEEIEEEVRRGKERARLMRWLRRQMGASLTPIECRYLLLYYCEGLTYRQVGKRTQTQASSAHRGVQRALRKLKRHIEREGGAERMLKRLR